MSEPITDLAAAFRAAFDAAGLPSGVCASWCVELTGGDLDHDRVVIRAWRESKRAAKVLRMSEYADAARAGTLVDEIRETAAKLDEGAG